MALGLDIPMSCMDNIPLVGGTIDSFKHFDMYDHDVVYMLLNRLGWDKNFLDRMYEIWTTQRVVDKIAGSYGTPYTPTNGLGQGCSFSLEVVKLTASLWCKYLDKITPTVQKCIFIDDRCMRTHSIHEHAVAQARTVEFDLCLGNQVNFDKSVSFANTTKGRRRLRNTQPPKRYRLRGKRKYLR